VPRSRAAVSCLPAGCFPCRRRLGSYHQPADRWARRQHWNPGRPQPGLEAEAAALHGQAGAALLDTYHNEWHPIGLLSIYAAAGLCPVRLPHGSKRRGAPLIDYGRAVTMGYRYTARRPYSAPRRTSRRRSPQGAIAGEPGIRAPHVAVTFGGREIFPPSTCTNGASCCLPGPMARRGSRLRRA
jgi:hypothetical protein